MVTHEVHDDRSPMGRSGSHRLLPFAGITIAIVAVLAHLGGGAAVAHVGLGAIPMNLRGGVLVAGLVVLVIAKLLVVFAARRSVWRR